MNKKNVFLIILILVIVSGGGFLYTKKDNHSKKEMAVPTKDEQPFEKEQKFFFASSTNQATSSLESGVFTDDINNSIHITNLSAQQEIASPLSIEGEAVASWYDDEKFSVQIINEQGNVLGSSVAQAKQQDTPGEFIPFIVTVDFDAGLYFTGYVVLQNARDKSVSLKVPVQLSQKTNERVSGGCKVTGCSNQVCAESDVVTDCMYKEEFLCYQKARCERQTEGNCEWTTSKELTLCLAQFQEE